MRHMKKLLLFLTFIGLGGLAHAGPVFKAVNISTVALPTGSTGFYMNGSTTSFVMDSSTPIVIMNDGEVRQPMQPCFIAYATGTYSGQIGDGSIYTVQFRGESIDVGDDFTISTFTATVPGTYLFNVSIDMKDLDPADHTEVEVRLVTSNGDYSTKYSPLPSANTRTIVNVNTLAPMDEGDKAHVDVIVSGGTSVVDIVGSNTTQLTRFSGTLIN